MSHPFLISSSSIDVSFVSTTWSNAAEIAPSFGTKPKLSKTRTTSLRRFWTAHARIFESLSQATRFDCSFPELGPATRVQASNRSFIGCVPMQSWHSCSSSLVVRYKTMARISASDDVDFDKASLVTWIFRGISHRGESG
jgi:hypothetical protein